VDDKQTRYQQQGVALAMVLWFIAALSLLVAGIVSSSRTDVRQVQLQLQYTKAAAAGDGASHLAMRDLLLLEEEAEFKGRGIFMGEYIIGLLNVSLRVVPTTGLININSASLVLLADMFEGQVGMSEEQAQDIALNIIIWRGNRPAEDDENVEKYVLAGKVGPRYSQFETTEDLMQVLGINRDVYERIADLVVALPAGGKGVDPLSAPLGVLTVVAGDADIAQQIIATRAEDPFQDHGVSDDIPEAYITQGVNTLFRLDADVMMEDGNIYRRRRWIERGGSRDGLPWRVVRSEPVRAIGG
jgi:type II secretory pathway component PulK